MKYETSLRISKVILVICLMVFISACNRDKPPVENPLKEEDTEKMDTGMYWTTTVNGEIRRANLDGSNIETLLTGLGKLSSLALDVSGGKMYWIEAGLDEDHKIRRANLDGSNIETLLTGVRKACLVLDVSGGKMYWIEGDFDGGYKIRCANLDGSNETLIEALPLNSTPPDNLALDVSGGKMYWPTLRGGAILRANLNGSNIEALPVDLLAPKSLTLDVSGGKMYWADEGVLADDVEDDVIGSMILRANLDGSNIEIVLMLRKGEESAHHSIALDVSGNKIYWIGPATNEIWRANLDGSNAITLNGEEGIFGRDLGFIALDVSDGF